jgi:hypothetical protein
VSTPSAAKRRVFSQEFKLEAIRLMEPGQKKSADLARELGVPRNRPSTREMLPCPPGEAASLGFSQMTSEIEGAEKTDEIAVTIHQRKSAAALT